MTDNIKNGSSESSASQHESGKSGSLFNPNQWIESIGSVVTRGLGYAPKEHIGILVIAFLVTSILYIIAA